MIGGPLQGYPKSWPFAITFFNAVFIIYSLYLLPRLLRNLYHYLRYKYQRGNKQKLNQSAPLPPTRVKNTNDNATTCKPLELPRDMWLYIMENYCTHEELVALERVSKQMRAVVLTQGDIIDKCTVEEQQAALVQQQVKAQGT